jgi:cytochrome c biogenesis protein CcdA
LENGLERFRWELLLLVGLILGLQATSLATPEPEVNVVVYGSGCLSCFKLYTEDLSQALSGLGIEGIEIKYTVGNVQAEAELEKIRSALGVPQGMRGETAVCLDGRFLFEGEVPAEIIVDFIANHIGGYERLVVFRDELQGKYKLINERGEIIECNLEESVSECSEEDSSRLPVIALVLVSGLLDGINPCAFAVLLFFVGLLVTTGTGASSDEGRRVLRVGSVYIASVFVAYLIVGLGLYEAVTLLEVGPWSTVVGASLMIFLGLINVADYAGARGFRLRIPLMGLMAIYDWARKMTIPATIIAGFLVAVFEFPCTGGVYFGIISLLASRTTLAEGLAYLVAYNLSFILPLVAVFVLAVKGRIGGYSLGGREHRRLKLLSGSVFIVIGLALLLWGAL